MSFQSSPHQTVHARCCVVGGGPAGIMLGLLLARAGIDIVVLEKHADFLRDFRGDTIHPSTLELMQELGLLEAFLKRPHREVRELSAQIGDCMLSIADFTHLRTTCKFLALMPQWDFLNFLAEVGRRYPGFQLRMETGVTDLIIEHDRVVGVRAVTPDGALEVRADLVIGADGRHSIVREKARLEVVDIGAPMDVLWLRFSRHTSDREQILGRVDFGKIMVMLDRGEYWQCAFVIRKGAFDEMRRGEIDAFRDEIGLLVPFLRERLKELRDWNDVKLLTVTVDRLREWFRPGLLCIGDAAHAMSPIGGVGINLAVQDAVAASNILAPAMSTSQISSKELAQVQRRRMFPTIVIQRIQVFIQNRIVSRVLRDPKKMSPPLALRILAGWPLLRRIPAQIVGVGIRPEHIRTPPAHNSK